MWRPPSCSAHVMKRPGLWGSESVGLRARGLHGVQNRPFNSYPSLGSRRGDEAHFLRPSSPRLLQSPREIPISAFQISAFCFSDEGGPALRSAFDEGWSNFLHV